MVTFATSPASYEQIWSDAYKIYKTTFSKVWFFSILLALSISITSIYSQYFKNNPNNFSTAKAVIVAVVFFIAIYLTNIILFRIETSGTPAEQSLKNSLQFVLRKYSKLFISLFFVAIATVLSMMALVIPGVFVAIMLLFVAPLILFDNQGIIGAIIGSCSLVWKNWFRTFFIILPALLINVVISFIINVFTMQNFAVAFLLNLLLAVFYFPFFYSLVLVQFHDLKLRKVLAAKVTPVADSPKASN